MTLRFKYETIEFEKTDIHIKSLRNRQEFFDPDKKAEAIGICDAAWPIFGVIWPSSEVLARHLYMMDLQDTRILEVGCGIGLPSLLLNHLSFDITAMDYHPEVQGYLNINSALNNDEDIPFIRTRWSDQDTEIGQFDMIIGSDLLYEDEHIEQLSSYMLRHLKPKSKIILVDPGRRRYSKFCDIMQEHGFICTKERQSLNLSKGDAYQGYIISLERC